MPSSLSEMDGLTPTPQTKTQQLPQTKPQELPQTAPPSKPQKNFDIHTYDLMKNWSLGHKSFANSFFELAWEEGISLSEWRDDIMAKIDTGIMFNINPSQFPLTEYSRFIELCCRIIRPLKLPGDDIDNEMIANPPPNFDTYTQQLMENVALKQKYIFRLNFLALARRFQISAVQWRNYILARIDSKTLDMSNMTRAESKRFIYLCSCFLADIKLDTIPYDISEFLVPQESAEDLAKLGRFDGLSDSDKRVILINRQLLMTVGPNVVEENRRGICNPGEDEAMKVGDMVGRDTRGSFVYVAGFEEDGRPFFEILPELLDHDIDGNEVYKIGYNADGRPITGIFDREKFLGFHERGHIWINLKECFEYYVSIDDLVGNDKGLLVGRIG